MGGLVITDRVPAPSYEFEMLNTTAAGVIDEETGEPGQKTLFLHYRVRARARLQKGSVSHPRHIRLVVYLTGRDTYVDCVARPISGWPFEKQETPPPQSAHTPG